MYPDGIKIHFSRILMTWIPFTKKKLQKKVRKGREKKMGGFDRRVPPPRGGAEHPRSSMVSPPLIRWFHNAPLPSSRPAPSAVGHDCSLFHYRNFKSSEGRLKWFQISLRSFAFGHTEKMAAFYRGHLYTDSHVITVTWEIKNPGPSQ